MSEINPEELEIRIRKWLEKSTKVDIQNLYEEKNHFVLSITDSKDLYKYPPIQIRNSKEKSNIISIGWSWKFPKEDVITFKNIDQKTKLEIHNKMVEGFLLMNISLKFIPSLYNLQSITCFNQIYLDGLSQDRFLDIMNKLYRAYLFTMGKFNEYLKFPKPFDPDDLT